MTLKRIFWPINSSQCSLGITTSARLLRSRLTEYVILRVRNPNKLFGAYPELPKFVQSMAMLGRDINVTARKANNETLRFIKILTEAIDDHDVLRMLG